MNALLVLGAALAVGLFAYVGFALLFPEKLQ